jgi:hypothetical protein
MTTVSGVRVPSRLANGIALVRDAQPRAPANVPGAVAGPR